MWHPARLSAPVGNPVEPGQCLVAASTVLRSSRHRCGPKGRPRALVSPGRPWDGRPGWGWHKCHPLDFVTPPCGGATEDLPGLGTTLVGAHRQ